VKPGEIVELSVETGTPVERVTLTGLGEPKDLWRTDAVTRWRGLVGIDVEIPPGPLTLTILATAPGATTSTTYALTVEPAVFAERHLKVDPRFVTPPAGVRPRIEREARRLNALYALVSTDLAAPTVFAPPVPQPRSSPFGVRSIFNGEPRSRHNGLDFASPAGTRIRAPAPGRIVLVDDLYYTGNTVVIDHGHGLVSLFAHMTRTGVVEGTRVRRGALLGTVGSTGRSTGPHLHWTVRLAGARVDPAALLDLFPPSRPPPPRRRAR
jgi:murein DD-endopeptidase MepM/ murein hydrolase activator NlpD